MAGRKNFRPQCRVSAQLLNIPLPGTGKFQNTSCDTSKKLIILVCSMRLPIKLFQRDRKRLADERLFVILRTVHLRLLSAVPRRLNFLGSCYRLGALSLRYFVSVDHNKDVGSSTRLLSYRGPI
jgi:hypothetical protein